jgi:hypothetical protein
LCTLSREGGGWPYVNSEPNLILWQWPQYTWIVDFHQWSSWRKQSRNCSQNAGHCLWRNFLWTSYELACFEIMDLRGTCFGCHLSIGGKLYYLHLYWLGAFQTSIFKSELLILCVH